MNCASQIPSSAETPAKVKFLVEATSTRNELLTAEIDAQEASEAEERATEQFKCEGHIILSATASEVSVKEGMKMSKARLLPVTRISKCA